MSATISPTSTPITVPPGIEGGGASLPIESSISPTGPAETVSVQKQPISQENLGEVSAFLGVDVTTTKSLVPVSNQTLQKFAKGFPPIDGEVTELPPDEKTTDDIFLTTDSSNTIATATAVKARMQELRQDADFVRAEEAVREEGKLTDEGEIIAQAIRNTENAKKQSEPTSEQPPMAPKQEQIKMNPLGILKAYRERMAREVEQKRQMEALIKGTQQSEARKEQPNANASPDTTSGTSEDKQENTTSDTSQQESKQETPKTYQELIKEAKSLVEEYVKEQHIQTIAGLKDIHAKTKNEAEANKLTEAQKKEYDLYKKILWTKLYQNRTGVGEYPLTEERVQILAQEAMQDCNIITNLQNVTEASKQAEATKLATDIEQSLNKQLEEMKNNPAIPPTERDKVNEHMDQLVDYVLSDEKGHLTLLQILVALGLIALSQGATALEN